MDNFLNKIIEGNCIEVLKNFKKPFVDLIFADPPFNIGYQYDMYKDNINEDKYLAWTEDWMSACAKALKPNGSFYVAICDEYAAEIKIFAERNLKMNLRNWIIWHYSFGQQTKSKFARAHTHILYFVKDEKTFTFNSDTARVLSDRQKKYKDKRANPNGKLPDDVWNEYPRVCGTFDEREGWHPCQMPESLLARIIRVSSNENDLVMDPFSGSGTTCVVAHKLKRNYFGIEISPDYVKDARKRVDESEGLPIEGEVEKAWNKHYDSELKWFYHENKIKTETLEINEHLLTLFTTKFNQRIGKIVNPYTPKDVKKRLVYLRKAGKLGPAK